MATGIDTIRKYISESPYRNIYWFARFLLNTDQYGALGRTKEKSLLQLVSRLESVIYDTKVNPDDKLISGLSLIEITFQQFKNNNSPRLNEQIDALFAELKNSISCTEDLTVFCITVKHVTTPANTIIASIPSNDEAFSKAAAKAILDKGGPQKVGLALHQWDTLGVRGCLDEERALIVEGFDRLMRELQTLKAKHSLLDDQLILTAFIQEIERRAAQKRKSRGGKSLETMIDFLFDYYKFKSSPAPSHFDTNFEVDKWFKCKDGWLIGISLKRTLRERWKQTGVDRNTLDHFKIKELWQICTYDKDLSDDKVVNLGTKGHIFYLWEDSDKYKKCIAHPSMKRYVRPLCEIVDDIRELMHGK